MYWHFYSIRAWVTRAVGSETILNKTLTHITFAKTRITNKYKSVICFNDNLEKRSLSGLGLERQNLFLKKGRIF